MERTRDTLTVPRRSAREREELDARNELLEDAMGSLEELEVCTEDDCSEDEDRPTELEDRTEEETSWDEDWLRELEDCCVEASKEEDKPIELELED